jgi:hypothetical protein
VLAALVVFVWHRRRQDGWWVLWMWLIMALTSLTKGLLGFVLPLVVMGSYSLLEEGAGVLYIRLSRGSLSARWSWMRERLRWFFNFKTPAAIMLAGAIYYLPFAVSHSRTNSQAGLYLVFRENVVRFFEPFDHRGPIYLYVYVLFGLMAPWSVFIPAALLEVHRKVRYASMRALANSDLFALVYFWGIFAFFTLSRSRRTYYLLPILPAAALVVARLLSANSAELWAPVRRLMKIGYGIVAAVVIAFGIAFLAPMSMRPAPFNLLPPSPSRTVFLIGWLVCLGTIFYAWLKFSARRAAVSTAVIAYLALSFLFMVAMPQAEAYRFERSFARAVRANVGANVNQLAFFNLWGPGLVYYLAMPPPIALFNTTPQVAAFAHSQGGAWLIARAKDVPNIKLPNAIRAAEPKVPWDSPSEDGARYVLLRVP